MMVLVSFFQSFLIRFDSIRFDLVRIPIDEVREDWLSSSQFSENLGMIANHYGLFDDLFKQGYFVPRFPLQIHYPFNDEQITPVYNGNRLYAKDVREEKSFRFRIALSFQGN